MYSNLSMLKCVDECEINVFLIYVHFIDINMSMTQ